MDTSLPKKWLKLKPWAEAALKVVVVAEATAPSEVIVETAEIADHVVTKAEAAMVAHAIMKSPLLKPKPKPKQWLKPMLRT